MVLRKRHNKAFGAIVLLSFLGACTVTPEPLPESDHIERSKSDLDRLHAIEFVPTRPITLHEAMARAVAFNLKRRVSQIERRIAEAELEQSNYEMLPTLEVNARKDRTDVQISRSDDRITKSADASFTWNLLDLGVSYARAKQRADEVLVAREKERKALQDIIRQVNTAFWRAATGQRLIERVGALSKDLKLAMQASRRMEETRATDVISAVAFRREVVESVRQALSVQRELNEARSELAELLNIRPGTEFTLALPKHSIADFRLPMSAEKMEHYALLNRPELRIEDYNERIGEWQAREALYNMLPGLNLSVGRNYSSESTNLSPNWISTGMNLGMNIFNLFSGSSEIDAAEKRSELARQQRLAVSLAVLTQVHIARIKFRNAEQQMRLVREIADSDRHIARLVGTSGEFLNKDFFEAIRLATRRMNSEMDEQRTFVDLVSNHAEVMHAIGQDVLPDSIPVNDIPTLTSAIRDMMATWYVSGSDKAAPSPVRPSGTPMDRLVNAMLPANREAQTAAAGPLPSATAEYDLDYDSTMAVAAAAAGDAGAIGTAAAAEPDRDAGSVPPAPAVPATGESPDLATGQAEAGAKEALPPTDTAPARPPEEHAETAAVAAGPAETEEPSPAAGAMPSALSSETGKPDGTSPGPAAAADEPAVESQVTASAASDESGPQAGIGVRGTVATPPDLAESAPAPVAAAKAAAGPSDPPQYETESLPDDPEDPASDFTAATVEEMSNIAPASGGPAATAFQASEDWVLRPAAPYRPAVAPTGEDTARGRTPQHFVVSLGAFSQQENAFKLFEDLRSGSPGLFDEHALRVVLRPGDSGPTYYYVQTDPLPDRRSANEICRALKRSGRACYVTATAD